MFSRIVTLVYAPLALTVFAAATCTTTTVTATAPASTATQPASQCNTGPVQCCNSVQSATTPSVLSLLGLLGIVLSDLNVLVGLQCSPITAVGIGGNSCNAQTVCCQHNEFNALIAIGCVPVNINL